MSCRFACVRDITMAAEIIPPIVVSWTTPDNNYRTSRFTEPFLIGRIWPCDVCIDDKLVSREHAQVYYEEGQWWIRDHDSTNGLFVQGRQVRLAPLIGRNEVQLGNNGPVVRIETQEKRQPPQLHIDHTQPRTPTEFLQRYIREDATDGGGEYTMLVRHAFARATGNMRRIYRIAISVVSIVLVVTVGIVVYQHYRLKKMHDIAVELFYNLKTVELQAAKLSREQSVVGQGDTPDALVEIRHRLGTMRARYDDFLAQLDVFGPGISESDRLILRMARIFGECELEVPKGFTDEVRKYIARWKSTGKFEKAVQLAKAKGYAEMTYRAMLDNDLPPQFFYLALKESGFRDRAIGPLTRFGIAKGPWQFIPNTAIRYGLKTGPLIQLRKYDPRDERHDFKKAARAAARYIGDLYTTESQASGLLVIASYNWGENNVRRLIRKMPENPKERNFWQLIKRHRIPKETYDYVMYIFSAAVIGENPRAFGFEMDNPLIDAHSERLDAEEPWNLASGLCNIGVDVSGVISRRCIRSVGLAWAREGNKPYSCIKKMAKKLYNRMNNELKACLGADRAINRRCTGGSDRFYAIFSTPHIIQLGGKPEDSRSRVAKGLQ
jgi:membrane-bound lytic murein transglycosylase D